MMTYPHLAARLFGVPLLLHRAKLEVLLTVLAPRFGLEAQAAETEVPEPKQDPPRTAGVWVQPIYGTLVRRCLGLDAASGLASYQRLAADLAGAAADPAVRAILLDIDSPGGEAGGVFDLADQIRAINAVKPVWAIANDHAFSAAYALAAGASRVVVARSGGAGSIGVMAVHVDQSGYDAQEGLRYTTVFAGERKNDLDPHQPLTETARGFLQAQVDRLYEQFVASVAAHRQLDAAAVRATQAGLFFGDDAVAAGLADAVGTFDDTLAELKAFVTGSASAFATPPSPAAPPPLPTENAMNDVTSSGADAAPATSAEPTAGPATVPPAVEIAQLCTLAGCADRIANYLEAGTPVATVRSELLRLQVAATGEIASHISPDAPRSAAGANGIDPNLLLKVAQARAGKAQ